MSTETTQSYTIHQHALPELQKKIERLSRTAVKLGLPPFRVAIGEPENKPLPEKDGIKRYAQMFPVTVTGQQPQLNGWAMLAKLDHTEHGNIINRPRYLDEDDPLPDKYRDCKPNCDHCNTVRQRNETYIFVNEESGELKQIGSTCIKDYFGHDDPHALLSLWDNMLKLDHWADTQDPHLDEAEESLGGSRIQAVYDLDTVIATSIAVVRIEGRYYSASNPDPMGLTTKHYVMELLRRPNMGENKKMAHQIINEADQEKTKEVTQWLSSITNPKTDYEHNLSVLARSGMIDEKRMGLAVSAPAAYERMFNQKQRQAQLQANSQHIGKVKDKIKDREVIFDGMAGVNTQWGTTFFCRMTDAETGGQFIWKTSSPLLMLQGERYTVNATIKDHSEYKGIKQTDIFRVACPDLKVIEALRTTSAQIGTPEYQKLLTAQLRKVNNINTINGYHETILQEVTQAAVAAINNGKNPDVWKPAIETVLKAGADPHLNNRQGKDIRSPLDMALHYLDDPTVLAPVFLEHMRQQGVDMATVDTIISRDPNNYYHENGLMRDEVAPALAVLEKYGMPRPGAAPYSADPDIRSAPNHQEIVAVTQPDKTAPATPGASIGDTLPTVEPLLDEQPASPAPHPAAAKPVKDSEMRAFFSLGM